MASSQPRAALYARISQAVEDVDKTANQLARLREQAKLSGYVVTAEFEDDDISAYQGKRERPGWDALLSAVGAGQVDVVMATAPDRFTRGSAVELEAFKVLCARNSVKLHTLTMGVQDPDDPATAAVMQIMDALGGLEVAQKTARQHARISDDVRNGISPATRRVFGFEAVKGRAAGIRESEAALIREAVDSILDGGTVYAVAKAWRDAGVKTSLGTDWTTSSVKRTLLRPRLAGWLTHKGELISPTLPAIISQEDHEALVTLLNDPSRKVKPGPKETALLSGIMQCRCGGTMVRSSYRGKYFCTVDTSRTKGDRSGPHQSIRLEVADAAVEDAVMELLSDGTLEAPQSAEDIRAVQAELDANGRAQDAAQDVLMDPDIKDKRRAKARVVELEAARAVLEDKRDALIAKRAQGSAFDEFMEHFQAGWTEDTSADAAAYDRASASWNALSMERKRDIIRGAFDVTLGEGWGAARVIARRKSA
ncbi:recombinase family protein [Curtobacterium flaccumfaciens]|uniref:recombinase family protein n=1 Tax=Curtobacterium flaccumfaciens TaxID=2035 RepID=UPI00137579D2|nr:recombinase family protein [Curtobacterium flaccumfaciens]